MSDTFYVTTPIYYVNDRPHIGHVYTTTLADVLARYHRLRGAEVFFLTGTDEHATKVVDAAAARDLSTQAWADQNAAAFREAFARFGMSHDDFIRTSEARHKDRVTAYVKELLESGDVYLGEYEGWYDAGQEEYVPDTKAKEYEFKSPVNKKPLVRKTEKNYFFKLSAYGERLRELLETGQVRILPEARKNEVLGRIREGLNDVPISRTGAGGWGIQVPGDEAHTIYVWIDALFNYLSTVDTDERRHLWPAQVHAIGKDILWFHTVIWFSMLLALSRRPGYEWVRLPGCVYAHSFWTSEGQKMSKSLGNFLDLEKLAAYVDAFGLDALRHFLVTQGPLGTADSDFAHARFAEVYNADLANTLGNCFSRVSNMTQRYFAGELPALGEPVQAAVDLPAAAATAATKVQEAMERLAVDEAAAAGLELVRAIDGYIEQTQPFKLAKDPEKLPQVATVLHTCAEALRVASVLLWPFLPGKVEELWRRIGCGAYGEALQEGGRGQLAAWSAWGGLVAGTPIEKGKGLFPRYQPPKPKKAPPQPKKKKKKAKPAPLGPAPEISFEQFVALDLRIARVRAAEPVPKTDKLLKLELELAGGERRTVCSGIRAWYEPEALVGRQVVYLANLAPRTIRGIESQGMVLAANDVGDAAVLLRAEREVPDGARVS